MSATALTEHELLQAALRTARDTRLLELARGARLKTAEAFASLFGGSTAMVIADEHTIDVSGKDVVDSLRRTGQRAVDPVILAAEGLYAEYTFVDELVGRLAPTDAVPIAVGAGAINDLVKLAAHRCGRPYLVVATAASMDGYTAYGASITYRGSKQTFDCPAPRGVIADLDVIAEAPEGMNASGYADLAAKCPAGADWILADALGEEPINRAVWDTVQNQLRFWMADPGGVRRRDLESLRRITTALMMSGFAMQAASSSRPASGAEHQFSHLWDMEHHTYQGATPSHGFKVGIGSLASLALYEALGRLPIAELDIDAAVESWPDDDANRREIDELFGAGELAAKAHQESAAKLPDRAALAAQLETLRRAWPQLQRRLAAQIIPAIELRDHLREAGAACAAEQIGIDAARLRRSYRQAYHIRRRFTVLDVARRSGLWEPALDDVFRPASEGAAL
jgi:glycerol-1-phosphate dehydrogenase [NAD(P)+]